MEFKSLSEYRLEGKSGASSRGDSSSKIVYESSCTYKARHRISVKDGGSYGAQGDAMEIWRSLFRVLGGIRRG